MQQCIHVYILCTMISAVLSSCSVRPTNECPRIKKKCQGRPGNTINLAKYRRATGHQYGKTTETPQPIVLLIQTTLSCSLLLAVSENVQRSCRPHGRAAVVYIAAKSIFPLGLHVTKCCRRNGLLIAQLPIRLSTLVEEQQGR